MKIRGLRWYIAGLLCLVTAFNYLDRQTLALLAGTLEKVWGITTIQYSYITAAWLTSYTIMYAVSGRLIDFFGTRRGLAAFVLAWSGVDALHALARTALQFSFCRFLLGATEAANMPACVKAVTEWFPMRERAMAVGIFNSGTALGAAAAAPIVAAVTLHFGWRYMFLVGSALSAAWLVAWLLFYREPGRHPWLTAGELAVITEDGAANPKDSPANGRPEPVPIGRILAMPEAWGCILARMLTDPISYFFAYWAPLFLQQKRGFDLAALGRYYWIPYVGLALGNLAGGAVPGWLIRRGWSLNRSRKTVMFAASCVTACCFILITRVSSPAWAVALIGGAMFCHAAWASMTLPAEVFPQHVVGSVSGFAGALGSLVSAITMLAIGRTVAAGSFVPVFIIYSALPMTGLVVVCVLIRKLGSVREVPAWHPN